MKQLKGPLVINRTTHRKRPKVIIISVINYMMSADVDTPLVSRYIFNLSIFNYLYNHTWKVCGNLATGFHNLEPIFRFWSHFWSRFSDLGANNWVWKKLSKKLLIKTSLIKAKNFSQVEIFSSPNFSRSQVARHLKQTFHVCLQVIDDFIGRTFCNYIFHRKCKKTFLMLF